MILIHSRSELCMAVESMFSYEYLYRFYGTNDYADRAERAAFNALPAALTPDCASSSILQTDFGADVTIRVGAPIRATDQSTLGSEFDRKAIFQRRTLRQHFRSGA